MATLSGKVWHGYETLLLNIEPQDHSKAGTSQRTCIEPKLRYLNEDCEGWSLFGCHGSVTEHWLQKVSWVRLPVTASLFTFLHLHLITSTFINFPWSIHTLQRTSITCPKLVYWVCVIIQCTNLGSVVSTHTQTIPLTAKQLGSKFHRQGTNTPQVNICTCIVLAVMFCLILTHTGSISNISFHSPRPP